MNTYWTEVTYVYLIAHSVTVHTAGRNEEHETRSKLKLNSL